MQGAAFLVGEVIALIVSNQVDDCPVRQACRFVENEPAFLNMGSANTFVQWIRASTVWFHAAIEAVMGRAAPSLSRAKIRSQSRRRSTPDGRC